MREPGKFTPDQIATLVRAMFSGDYPCTTPFMVVPEFWLPQVEVLLARNGPLDTRTIIVVPTAPGDPEHPKGDDNE
ncbi:MAG: hypothetical protein JSV86_16990 [Gemmatimonadota bacterium]|nr:MAG: hypothetical protein JSV86_16990 [Gemmatimonadota bacterium]